MKKEKICLTHNSPGCEQCFSGRVEKIECDDCSEEAVVVCNECDLKFCRQCKYHNCIFGREYILENF